MMMPLKTAKIAPADRVIAFQSPSLKATSELIIVRDTGLAAGGCYYGVMIDQTLSARLDVAEKASFYVAPGARELRIVRDPHGQGLCHVGDDNVVKTVIIKPNEVQKYRLTLDLSGQPDLKVYLE